MKPARVVFVLGLLFAAGISAAYSIHTARRMKDLERRLQQAEALLGSQSQPQSSNTTEARIADLERRVQRAEQAVAPPRPLVRGSTAELEQRIRNIVRQIKPHLELIPPYVPDQ